MSKDQTEIFAVTIQAGGKTTLLDNMSVTKLFFIEDIYCWCKSGKLVMYDNMGIWEYLPLVGDEKITIEYVSPDGGGGRVSRTYTFSIFKVSAVDNQGAGNAGTREQKARYSLEVLFVEEPHFKLQNPAYSKTYRDWRYYDIIKDIYKLHVGIAGFVEEEIAEEKIEFFSMSQRTPAQAIKWLGERIKGVVSGESGYMYYSNTKADGESYNFCTLEKLLRDAPLITEPPGDPRGVYFTGGSANEYAYNTILNFTTIPSDKTAINYLAKHTFLGYDIYRKYMVKREYDYFTSLGKYTCMGAKSLYNGAEIMSHLERGKETLTGESGDAHMLVECLMDNIYYGEWVKQYCAQQLVEITVRGHCLRYAGGKIEINWLAGDTHEKINKQMQGRYLVRSITHQFSTYGKPIYQQKMVLIKNGYWGSDSELSPAPKNDLATNQTSHEINKEPGTTEFDDGIGT